MNINYEFNAVKEFEDKISKYFNSPYAVAVDSCTHGLELCLRLTGTKEMHVPYNTYLSVPMLGNKLGIKLKWRNYYWYDYYYLTTNIIDAAVYWSKDGYIPGTYMCLSFQYQKHLSLGRAGMILCDDENAAQLLKKMTYDGRLPDIPWRSQNVETMGYHYYMTPETAALGLVKLNEAMTKTPKQWTSLNYPDLTKMEIFKK